MIDAYGRSFDAESAQVLPPARIVRTGQTLEDRMRVQRATAERNARYDAYGNASSFRSYSADPPRTGARTRFVDPPDSTR